MTDGGWYILPPALGGGLLQASKDLPDATFVWFKVPGGTLEIRRAMLTPVGGPELPPEPADGAVVLVGAHPDQPRSGRVFRRYSDGWAEPNLAPEAPDGHDDWHLVCWAQVCAHGTPTLLTPR